MAGCFLFGATYISPDIALSLTVAHHEICVTGLFRMRLEHINRIDNKPFATVRALPYREWCAPVPLAAYRPVFGIREPLAHPSGADVRWLPVNLLIFCHELPAQITHADIPRVTRIVDEPRLATPTKWICMCIRFFLKSRLRSCKFFRISTDVSSSTTERFARKLVPAINLPSGFTRCTFGKPILFPSSKSSCTIHHCGMHDTGAVLGCDKICGIHLKCFLKLWLLAFRCKNVSIVVERSVFLPNEISA